MIINFNKIKENNVLDGDVLFNLQDLKIGESVKIYSSGEDIFLNEKIDIYTIDRKEDGYYLTYSKKNSFDDNGCHINFTAKIEKIGVSKYNPSVLKQMNLTNSEIDALKCNDLENWIIRKGFDLEGKFDDGLEFTYSNIIQVGK